MNSWLERIGWPEMKEIANANCFPLDRLDVEFSESVLIKNSKHAKQSIHKFKHASIAIALDDFDTGYASVGNLSEYAFDKIKLDHSLNQAQL